MLRLDTDLLGELDDIFNAVALVDLLSGVLDLGNFDAKALRDGKVFFHLTVFELYDVVLKQGQLVRLFFGRF